MRHGSFALVIATLTAVLSFTLLLRAEIQVADPASAYAATRRPDSAGRTYQNGNANTNDNGSDDNGDNNANDNDDFDNDDFDNDDFAIPPYVPPASSAPQIAANCSTPGRDTLFWSFDQKASLLMPRTSVRPMRVDLLRVVNAHEAPQPPGEFVDPHVYEVIVGFCDPIPLAILPVDATLTIHYSDAEVDGVVESRLVIGRLDMFLGRWIPVEPRSVDAGANTVSATIREPGYYMVWAAR